MCGGQFPTLAQPCLSRRGDLSQGLEPEGLEPGYGHCYFEQYKKDGACPPGIDLDRATLGFNIDNTAAFQAIEDSKALHARRWQTKEGTYRIKRRALPDVRDEPLQDVNAAASCSDDRPRWRCWDGDFAMGVQHHT